MKALVTGGAGFIGSNVVRALLDGGHEVVVLDNFSSGHRENLEGLPVRIVEGDIRHAGTVQDAMLGCERVFHLAASVGSPRSIEDPLGDSEINVLGTLTVLESARRQRVRKMVFASSAGIFAREVTLPIREDHPAEPETPYGASKLGAEKLCLVYAKLHGLGVVCLRFFNVYGPNQRYDAYGNVVPIFAERIFKREPIVIFGDGEQTRDFVHVHDVVRATIGAALANGLSGAFNIASGTTVTIKRLAGMMAELSGLNPRIEYAAPRQGDIRDSVADISAARRAFGYEPRVTLAEGLRSYLSWFATLNHYE